MEAQHEAQPDPLPEHAAPPPVKRFGCTVAGCTKRFHRREHLNRHLKSHDPNLQYKCHICGRRYARSDVLKRHIEFHPSSTTLARSSNRIAATSGDSSRSGEGETPPLANDGPGQVEAAIVQAVVDPFQSNQHLFQQDQHNAWSSFQQPADGRPPVPAPGFVLTDWAIDPSLATPTYNPLHLPVNMAPEQPGDLPSSAAATTPATSEDESLDGLDAHVPLIRTSVATTRLIATFFDVVHPSWPILHAPSFNPQDEGVPDVLLKTMAMLASWAEGTTEHIRLAQITLDQLVQALVHNTLLLNRISCHICPRPYSPSRLLQGTLRYYSVVAQGLERAFITSNFPLCWVTAHWLAP